MKNKSLKINKETLANNNISEDQMKSVKGGSITITTTTIVIPIVVTYVWDCGNNEAN